MTQCDPYGNHFIGFCLIDHQDYLIDNGTPTSLLLSRAMQNVVHQWYRRFGVPLPYHSHPSGLFSKMQKARAHHVDGGAVRQAIQTLGSLPTRKGGDKSKDVIADGHNNTSLFRGSKLKNSIKQPFAATPAPTLLCRVTVT